VRLPRTLLPCVLLAAVLVATTPTAGADCTGPLCGSFVEAKAYQPVDQRIDPTDGTLVEQTIGPARATWLGDPGNPSSPGSTSDSSARLAIAIDQGALAVETGSVNDSALGMIVQGLATSRAEWDEVLTVTSASVPTNTPVTLRLRALAVFGATAVHELPQNGSGSFNYATMDLTVNASLGGNPLLDSWQERAGEAIATSGVFAAAGVPVEITANALVGVPIHLDFALVASSASSAIPVSPPPPMPLELPTGETGGTAVVVFGIESDTPGVEIDSALLGGPVPGFDVVTVANALGHVIPVDVGAPVTVLTPEPASTAQGIGALAVVLGFARRPRSERGLANGSITISPVPEPSAWTLVVLGLVGLCSMRKRACQ
jgi:PEP-CTERM motif